MGLDDRIEAKRLEAMPEITEDVEFVLPASSAKTLFSDIDIPVGVYAGRFELEEVVPGSIDTAYVMATLVIDNQGSILIGESGNRYPNQVYLYPQSQKASSTTPAAFVLVKRYSQSKFVASFSSRCSKNIDLRAKLTLRRLI